MRWAGQGGQGGWWAAAAAGGGCDSEGPFSAAPLWFMASLFCDHHMPATCSVCTALCMLGCLRRRCHALLRCAAWSASMHAEAGNTPYPSTLPLCPMQPSRQAFPSVLPLLACATKEVSHGCCVLHVRRPAPHRTAAGHAVAPLCTAVWWPVGLKCAPTHAVLSFIHASGRCGVCLWAWMEWAAAPGGAQAAPCLQAGAGLPCWHAALLCNSCTPV